jgi:uncharacterized cupredoxin-like copper-binding protein
LLAGCAAGAPTVAPRPSDAVVVPVTLTDAFAIDPGRISVPTGKPIVFVVTNRGRLDHEFFVGDEQAQEAREQALAGSPIGRDEPTGIALRGGQTRELTLTFAAATPLIAGCHIPGHYPGGMKATIEVR